MELLMLDCTNPHHTRLVLSFIVQSELDYGDLDDDMRLLAWNQRQGLWVVVVNDQGQAVGIACTVSLSDIEGDALLWLEVLPRFRNRGYGRSLVSWMQQHTCRRLVIKSVPGASGFYRHIGVSVMR